MPTLAVPLTSTGVRQQTQSHCPSPPLFVWHSRSLGLWPLSVIYIGGLLESPGPTPVSAYGVVYGGACTQVKVSMEPEVPNTLGLEIQWS